jgi:hypothetical protein
VDFIERWLHVSPDGGSGALEVLYLVVIALVVASVVVRRRRIKAPKEDRR